MDKNMSDQNIKPNFNSNIEDEISLKDIVNFLVESWMAIVLTGLLGIVGSVTYLLITPNQYQATAQIQMAQISTNNSNNISPLGVNVEDPNLLMARLKLPTTYSAQEIKDCGFESSPAVYEVLAATTKFSAVKGVGSIIELKINRGSKEIAITCAQSLFENIKASQNQIIKPYVDEAKTLLVKYQDRLTNSQSLISRADRSGAALSAAYLANRDEVKFLTEEILRLNAFITSSHTRQAKLVSPIYASDNPVAPKKKIALIAGLFAGLFFGLLLMLGKRGFKAYKLSNSSNA
jgi:LPS O-antigen subunit length determinant protein (WzzB/FepE family)